MYRGNQEYFALKRRLIDDAKVQLNKLPVIDQFTPDLAQFSSWWRHQHKDLPSTLSEMQAINGLVYVYEWCDNDVNILGYGCNMNGDACCLKVNIAPRLFVASANVPVLREIMTLYGYTKLTVYNIKYTSNNFAVYDLMANYEMLNDSKCWLVAIETDTVADMHHLYYRLRNNENAYKYAMVTQYYDTTKQIMFELLIRKNALAANTTTTIDYTIPDTVMRWFDCNLNIYDGMPAPNLPIITFDIETVSDDPHRVPTGDEAYDILFSVSVHHVHTNVLYSLVYLPLLEESEEALNKRVLADGYDVVPDKNVDSSQCTNYIECYTSERELLMRTMQLLTLEPKLHILMGYNSLGYDIKYLLMRCIFYGLHVEHFIWREGYCFGPAQIHLDLFRIILMRYRFKSYTLNEVSKQIMRDSKTGVSAVALRYSFFRMYKYQKYFVHDECNEKMPSIRDTLHYNNADTLLVSKLESKTQSIKFLIAYAKRCQVPLSVMMTNYNKMQYKLWNECLVVGLNLGLFMGKFKQSTASIIYPVPDSVHGLTDSIELRLDLTENLNASDPTAEASTTQPRYAAVKKKALFPGGANFCLGEYNADNVQMYDYVTAYPLLMDRKNISDETVTILPANILLALHSKIAKPQEFTCFDYITHHGRTHSETIILYFQYIYNGQYCGGEFPFTTVELKKRMTAPVIIIWCGGRRGILSEIIAKFNAVRAYTKMKRNILDSAIAVVDEKISELTMNEAMMMAATTAEIRANEMQIDNLCEDYDDIFGDAAVPAKDDICGFDEADGCNDFGFDDDDDDNDENTNNNNDDDDGSANGIVEDVAGDFGFNDDDDDDEEEDNNGNMNEFGFDDDDDADDVVATTTDSGGVKETKTFQNPYNFEFANKYITIYMNKCCVIDEDELEKCDDKIAKLRAIHADMVVEQSTISNSYDMQKSLVASIYGCIGKMIPVVAATITCITRSTLLKSAQYCNSLGYEVLYIDTDSIMISSECNDLSDDLNRLYPYMEMEMKVARKCMFVKRKTYYKLENGTLKYGQNVNGPTAWRDCVMFFYNYNKIYTNDDIYQAFREFFTSIYSKLHSYTKVTSEFLKHFTHTIKLKEEYKTATVAYKLRQYLAMRYPEISGANKQTIYYHFDATSVLVPLLRPEIEIQKIEDLQHVNLFKYYQNMYTTIFNLIKFNIRYNNRPYNIALSSKYVQLQMLSAFLDVYAETFKSVIMPMPMMDSVAAAEQMLDNPIYTETLYDIELNSSNNKYASQTK